MTERTIETVGRLVATLADNVVAEIDMPVYVTMMMGTGDDYAAFRFRIVDVNAFMDPKEDNIELVIMWDQAKLAWPLGPTEQFTPDTLSTSEIINKIDDELEGFSNR